MFWFFCRFRRLIKNDAWLRSIYRRLRYLWRSGQYWHTYLASVVSGVYSLSPVERLIVRARRHFLVNLLQSKQNFIKILSRAYSKDSITLQHLYYFFASSVLTQNKDSNISILSLYDKKYYKLATIDAYTYDDSLHYSFLKDIFLFRGQKFYGVPAINAVLYDHGLLDPFAPDLPLEYDMIFDVGAFIGDSAVVLSKYLSVRGHVYSFEPDASAFSILKATLRMNGISDDTVYAINAPVGSTAGTIQLDSYVSRVGKGDTTLLKMDIEGFERYVLAGAKSFIAIHTPVIISAVYHLPTDIFVLPRIVESAYPGYTFYLRHHARPTPATEYYIVGIPDTL